MENQLEILINEIKNELRLRILEESFPRIIKCVNLLDEQQLWWTPNENMNSVANLILHLNGNIRQWFIATFSGISWTRIREKEFIARKSLNKSEILVLISILSSEIEENINRININSLLTIQSPQNDFTVSGYSIISHIIEHASYHTGQIAYLTKLQLNEDLGFYEDLDL